MTTPVTRVASDGRTVEIVDAVGAVVVGLTFALPGEPVVGWQADEEELALVEVRGVRSRLRSTTGLGGTSLSVTVDNLVGESVELPYLGVGVTVGDGYCGWSWTSDIEGLLAFASLRDGGGGVLVRLQQGFLRPAGDLPLFADEASEGPGGPARAAFHLSPPGARLGAHRRHQVTLEVSSLQSLDAAAAALPGWLPGLAVPSGTPVEFSLPDQAVVPGPGLSATLVDTDVQVLGPPGHGRVSVHGPRGVQQLRLSWAPGLPELLPDIVEGLVRRRPARASDAAGFVVADAVVRSLAPDRDRALDWLEQVDWLDRGSLLADATAGVLASTLGEARQLAQVWKLLARRPVTPGFGLVVMRTWLAGLSATGEPPAVAHDLLARPSDDAASALELALLTRRHGDGLDAPLAGLINELGASLPGAPVGLSAARAAVAVSLVRLTPESWGRRRAASEAAEKVERLLLADYVTSPDATTPPHRDLDGLAWLLLGQLGI